MTYRDENRRGSRGLHVIRLALALLGVGVAAANAQQQLQLMPGQQATSTLSVPLVRPAPTPMLPPSRSSVETLPQVRQQPLPQPSLTPPAEVYQPAPQATPSAPPILPAIFYGCWEGRVDTLDSIKRLPGAAKLGPWTPKTYRLCYRRTGNGPFDLTFTEAGVANDRRITNATGKLQLLSTDGRTYATMRALLQFDEFHVNDNTSGGSTFPVDELTELYCDIEPDGMHVRGQVYGQRSGQPWFRATWHATFLHTHDFVPLPE